MRANFVRATCWCSGNFVGAPTKNQDTEFTRIPAMRCLCLGLLTLVFAGCQCCPCSDVYSNVIDDTSDCLAKPSADCLYCPALDLNRIGKSDWCECRLNRLLCCRCCQSDCDDRNNCDHCTWTESTKCRTVGCTDCGPDGCASGKCDAGCRAGDCSKGCASAPAGCATESIECATEPVDCATEPAETEAPQRLPRIKSPHTFPPAPPAGSEIPPPKALRSMPEETVDGADDFDFSVRPVSHTTTRVSWPAAQPN